MKDQLFTEEKLNSLPKENIIMLLLQQSENFHLLSEQSAVIQKQNEQLLKQVEDLKEQLITSEYTREMEMIQKLFGAKLPDDC